MRNLDAPMVTAIKSGLVIPAFLGVIGFRSTTQHVWTGVGPLPYAGNTYLGLGSLVGVGSIKEGIDIRADGTSVSLSGIDASWYDECMADILIGAPASISFGVMGGGQLLSCYQLFAGQVDQPSVSTGPDDITISLALENKMVNLQRPNSRRYTSADQRMLFPNDCGFGWVEILNDVALVWGG